MNGTGAWYVAGWSDELGQQPLGRRIFGEPFVLFRDRERRARALHARCAHRSADLARGKVVGGCVECPFHGWRYDGEGQCVSIPSQPQDQKIPRSAAVASHALTEHKGVLWIWPGDSEPRPFSAANHDDFWAGGRTVRIPPQLLAAPTLESIETQLDLAHVPFIHAGSFGGGLDPLVTRETAAVNPAGPSLEAREDPNSPWRRRGQALSGVAAVAARVLGQAEVGDQCARFDVPAVVARRVQWTNGTWDRFVSYLTPADETHTWLFYETVRSRAPHFLADRVQRWFMRKVAAEGSMEATLPLRAVDQRPAQISVESDRVGLAARKLYRSWLNAGDGPQETLPPH